MADVYQIGISIAMQNGVSAVLGVIQKDLLKLNEGVMRATEGFGRLKLAIAGATGIVVGVEVLKGLDHLSRSGEKYTHQLELMKIAGMQFAEVQSAISAADRVSSTVMSTTPAENLKTIRELRMALASADVRPNQKADPAAATQEAVAHLETFQKISGIMSSVLSKDGKTFDGSGQAYELAKAAEILGLSQDPKKFDAVLEGWTKDIVASGGKLQGSDFFGTVKYLRGAGQGMSMEFLTEVLPSLMQELKTGKGSGAGGGAGNPLASLFAEIVGGTISDKADHALQSIHMIDEKKVHRSTTGKIKEVLPGAVVGSDLESVNPFEWVRTVLEPHIRKYTNFLDKNAEGELVHPGELRALIASLVPNRVAQQITSMMLMQQNRIAGDRGLIKSAQGIEGFDELSKHDPDLVRKELGEQWERLTTDIGKSISPAVTDMIYTLSRALAKLSEAVEAHPDIAKIVLEAVAAFSVLITVLGGIGLIGAVAGSLVTGGAITAVVAGITGLGAALVWLESKFNFVKRIKEFFGGGEKSKEVGQTLTSGINTGRDMFEDMTSGIRAKIDASIGWIRHIGDIVGSYFDPNIGIRFLARVGHALNPFRLIGSIVGSVFDPNIGTRLMTMLRAAVEPVRHVGDIINEFAARIWHVKEDVSALAVELAQSVKHDLLSLWVGLGEGLNSLIKGLAAWFAGLPGRIWSSITGTAPKADQVPPSIAGNPQDTLPKMPPIDGGFVNPQSSVLFQRAPANDDQTNMASRSIMFQDRDNKANLPPSVAPSIRGTSSDPLVVYVANQLTEASISRGVASNIASKGNRPAGGFTGADHRIDPFGTFQGMVN